MKEPAKDRREEYVSKFNLKFTRNSRRKLTYRFMNQLDLCKSDVERRLLLGVSE